MTYMAGTPSYLYLFGGFTGVFWNDLWRYDLTALNWTQLSPTGTGPTGRYEFIMFSYNNLVYIGYGWDNAMRSDMYSYNPTTNAWATVTMSGPAPSPRQSPAYCIIGNTLYLIAGLSANNNITNDIYALNLTTFTWSSISYTGSFTGRTNFGAAPNGNMIYFYGGAIIGGLLSDFVAFNTTTNAITQPTTSGTSPGQVSLDKVVSYNGIMYLYGGTNASGVAQDTLYMINLTTFAWTSIPTLLSYPRSSPAIAQNGSVLYINDGYTGGVGSTSINESWSVVLSGASSVASQLPTQQIYVNGTTFTYNGITFQCFIQGGIAYVRATVSLSAPTGLVVSLASIRLTTA